MTYRDRFLRDGNTNPVMDELTATSGTVAISRCRQANIQWLASDTSSSYRVALMPVAANTGTCSRENCAALLSNLGAYECRDMGRNYWVAWQVYNGETPITGTAGDFLAIERLG